MHVHCLRGAAALALIGSAVLAACSDNTSAAIANFYANMTGDQEVPAVSTAATGQGTVANFTGAAAPQVKVTYAGLSGAPTRITIQTGVGTATGPAVANVCGGTTNPGPACGASGTTYTAVMIGTNTSGKLYTSMLTNGGTYVNIYTAAHKDSLVASTGNTIGGEIRGALVFTPTTTQ
jgi:hypothetical protein